LDILEQRPSAFTSVISARVKWLLISTKSSAEFPDTVLSSYCHFLWVNEYRLKTAFAAGQFTQLHLACWQRVIPFSLAYLSRVSYEPGA